MNDEPKKACDMTLREMYAGMAMQGLVSRGWHEYGPARIAHDAWEIADAMMAEQEKRND